MQKFGDKSKDKQTVFIVSCYDKVEEEYSVLGVYNELEDAKSYMLDPELKEFDEGNVYYYLHQKDVE